MYDIGKIRNVIVLVVAVMLLPVFSACGRTAEELVLTTCPYEQQPILVTQPNELQPPLTTQSHEPLLPSDFIEYWLAQLTLEEKIGQLIMPRLPRGTLTAEGLQPWLDAIPFGGFIIFADNVQTVEQIQLLTSGLQAKARLPLLISVDEEGGRVSRVGRLFEGGATPAAFDIGKMELCAYEISLQNAKRLFSLGINMNFAPVADIWSNPANAVIGNRAFGHTAELVSPMVAASVQGLQNNGVFATIKHFPGHGDTYEDSHFQLAFHNHDIYRFWAKEALPFVSGIEAGAAAVMTGHISTPQVYGHATLLPWMQPWIDSGNLPATFSSFWQQDILRGELGFEGLIITDGLEMRALTNYFSCGQIALGAFLAGADILLIPANPFEAFEALVNGYAEGYFDMERLNKSVRRILQVKETLQ